MNFLLFLLVTLLLKEAQSFLPSTYPGDRLIEYWDAGEGEVLTRGRSWDGKESTVQRIIAGVLGIRRLVIASQSYLVVVKLGCQEFVAGVWIGLSLFFFICKPKVLLVVLCLLGAKRAKKGACFSFPTMGFQLPLDYLSTHLRHFFFSFFLSFSFFFSRIFFQFFNF